MDIQENRNNATLNQTAQYRRPASKTPIPLEEEQNLASNPQISQYALYTIARIESLPIQKLAEIIEHANTTASVLTPLSYQKNLSDKMVATLKSKLREAVTNLQTSASDLAEMAKNKYADEDICELILHHQNKSIYCFYHMIKNPNTSKKLLMNAISSLIKKMVEDGEKFLLEGGDGAYASDPYRLMAEGVSANEHADKEIINLMLDIPDMSSIYLLIKNKSADAAIFNKMRLHPSLTREAREEMANHPNMNEENLCYLLDHPEYPQYDYHSSYECCNMLLNENFNAGFLHAISNHQIAFYHFPRALGEVLSDDARYKDKHPAIIDNILRAIENIHPCIVKKKTAISILTILSGAINQMSEGNINNINNIKEKIEELKNKKNNATTYGDSDNEYLDNINQEDYHTRQNVLYYIAKKSETNKEMLNEIIGGDIKQLSERVLSGMALNKNADSDILKTLLMHPHITTHTLSVIYRHPNIDSDILNILSEHPNISESDLHSIPNHLKANKDILMALSQRSNIDYTFLSNILESDHMDIDVLNALLNNHNIHESNLHLIALHSKADKNILMTLSQRSNIPDRILSGILKSRHADIDIVNILKKKSNINTDVLESALLEYKIQYIDISLELLEKNKNNFTIVLNIAKVAQAANNASPNMNSLLIRGKIIEMIENNHFIGWDRKMQLLLAIQ